MSRGPRAARPKSGGRTLPVALFGIAGLALAACRGDIDERRVIVHDEGAVCLGESAAGEGGTVGSGVELSGGQPLPIRVRSVVLGDTCAKPQPTSCTVTRDGDRLLVKSELSWVAAREYSTKCPGVATVVEARCATDVLGSGKYRVILGTRTVDVELPSHLPKACTSDGDAPLPRVPFTAPSTTSPPVGPTQTDATTAPTGLATTLPPDTVPAVPATGVVAPEPPPSDKICLGPPASLGKSRPLRAGQPLAITITHHNACVGNACTKAPGKCGAKRQGQHILVTAAFPTPSTKPAQPCTEDCRDITATCKTDALPAGNYTVELAGVNRVVKVPTPNAPPCPP